MILAILLSFIGLGYKIKQTLRLEIENFKEWRYSMEQTTKFSRLKTKTKIYVIIAVTSCLITLFSGFKNAGSIDYRGHTYDAGSVFNHEEYSISGFGSGFDNRNYGEVGKAVWGDPEMLNKQLKDLRQPNFIFVAVFGVSTVLFMYLLWKDEEVFDLFVK